MYSALGVFYRQTLLKMVKNKYCQHLQCRVYVQTHNSYAKQILSKLSVVVLNKMLFIHQSHNNLCMTEPSTGR